MCDLRKSARYAFYLKFNLISSWLVVLLPFLLLGIYFTFDLKPDICDTTNDVLLFFTLFSLVLLNIKLSLMIIEEKNNDEES